MPIKYYSKNTNFYPTFILSNICVLISFNMIIRFLLTKVVNLFYNIHFHDEQILGYELYTFEDKYTYAAIITSILESILMITAYVIVVEKGKKILDYVLTNFCLELFLIIIYSGFPLSVSYWVFTSIKVCIIVIISEYIALTIDQQEISVNSNFISGTL